MYTKFLLTYSLYLEVVSMQAPNTILKKYIKQLAGGWVVGVWKMFLCAWLGVLAIF